MGTSSRPGLTADRHEWFKQAHEGEFWLVDAVVVRRQGGEVRSLCIAYGESQAFLPDIYIITSSGHVGKSQESEFGELAPILRA